MFLEQICPGQANSQPQAIDTFVYGNNRYIVYATGSKIALYEDPDHLIQIIVISALFDDHISFEPVVAVSGNSQTGKIALSYHQHIIVLTPAEDKWKVETKIKMDYMPTCLDWSIHGLLMGAGKEIVLIDSEWNTIWKRQPSTEIKLAKFEPRSNVFATVGKYDKLVTIWYPSVDTTDYQFTFISHPKYVIHFVWRKSSRMMHENDCTLFTMAGDGIGRFWSPLNLGQSHMLYLSAVIDSNQSLVTSEPEVNMHHHNEDVSLIHYIDSDEMQNAIYAQFKSHSKHHRLDQRLERLRDRIRDTPDYLFRIESDGSLTFWGIQHLNTLPRRIPRVIVVLRVAKVIDPQDVVYFLNPIHIMHDYSHIQSSSTIKPVELSLLTHNQYGQIRCFSLNLIDFLDTTNFSPRLHLKYNWLGHQHAISKLYQTQKNRFCTLGIDGQVNVWKYELRETCGHTTAQLHMDCSIHIDSENILSVPIDKDKYLAVYDGTQIKIYEFDNEDCHIHHPSQLCEGSENIVFSSLHVYNILNPDSGTQSHLLIGVSNSLKKIVTWHVSGLDIEYKGEKTMSEWTAEPDIVVSASQWAINTVSKLFHCLSSPKQLVIAVAMGTRILFYGIQDIQNTIHWEVLYTMHTSYESIQKISCGPNILALVSNDNILTIWMGMRSGVAPILVQTFKFDEPIQDIVWNVTSDAQFLLAVAFPRSIGIFGQKRASISCPQDDLWVCYTKFDVDTPEDITALTWVDCGVLIVAAGNQLRCYLKWLTQEDRVVKMHKTINNKLEPMSSVFDISYEVNGPLPFYHPEHLIHYIMWNKMDLVNATLGSLYHFLKQFVDEEDHTIQEFPPVSFPQILELQNGNAKKGHPSKQRYDLLFGDDEEHSNVDSDDDARPLTDNEVKNLIYQLKSRSLPGLNETEKMHLIALVDTIVELNQHGGSLDENGVRFTALLENHFHLKEILPSRGNQDLQPKDYIWALHSQSQDLLLEKCRHLHDNKLVWENARSLGIFMWLQKIDVVRDQMMAIARNIYLSKAYDRDPVDCTLFYFALRKKTIVQGLWKTTSHHKEKAAMIKFLANDFSDPRWQRAASKNAFALLGKQRFEYAAAFFLLADKLKDAVNVILKHVKDYQLAIALCRVYEGDHSPLLQDIIRGSVIPEAIINKDPWLASVSYWLLNEKQESIRAIVAIGSPSDDSLNEESVAIVYEPSLFIMYLYLKNMLKQEFVSYSAEYLFSLFVSQSYERLGCPLLALYILTRYRMKKPEQDKPNKECATDLFANENTKPSYSADLFADEPTQPSYATGLFADEPVKPSYSTDLFADEPAKPSYSTDLFADEPSKSSNDLFSDDDWLIGKKESSAGSFSDEDDRSNSDSSEDENTENDGLDGYKALLVVRMPQTFFHGASVLYNGLTEPDNFHETQYRSFFLKNRDALLKLGETLSIPASVFSRLLMEKSIETDVFPLYLYILNEGVPKDFDVHQFLRAFKVGCFEVNEIAYMPQTLDYATLIFIENWAEHVIKTFNIWSQLRSLYCNPETAASTTRTIALTTYISLALVTLKERHYENCWILVYKFKGFIETLASTERGALSHCISQLLVDDTKMVEMASNDFDSFSDESMFGFDMNEEVYRPLIDAEDHSVAANLLEIASLNYILSCIETAMQNLRKNNSELGEYLTEFIWTTLLDPIAYRTYCLKEIIIQQLENNLDRHNALKQFKTLRQKKYWHSIKSLSSPERLLPFIDFMPSTVNILSDDHSVQVHSVYHSTSTAYGFCINPTVKDSVAVCLKSEIQEIDLTKASENYSVPLMRSRSISSSVIGHDVPDSYPDTEDDDDSSDNELNVTSSKNSRKKEFSAKVSGTSTPVMSPTSTRTMEEMTGQKSASQTLNLEYLQESLRKSLNKGSEHPKTPSVASPNPIENSERERMITLKRPFLATCSESHPHYPFYITGCEIHNNGPSVMLWQYGQEREIASYYGSQGKVNRIHFDHFGQKFGAGDTMGSLCLWRFDAHAQSNKPYYTLQCRSKSTRDFTFIDSSSLIATAGTGTSSVNKKRDYVCLWDTLLPPSKAFIGALPGHEGGAYAIAYESNSQLLFSGGKKGEIVVSDIRQRTTMHTFTAHHSRIRSVAIDVENKALITGSVDGELKVWDVNTYKLRQSFDIQPRNRFLAPSFNRIPLKAFGVTQIKVMNDGYVYTSGPSGIIRCNRVI